VEVLVAGTSKGFFLLFGITLVVALTAGAQVQLKKIDRLLDPFTSREEIEHFLRTAEIVKIVSRPEGRTNPLRLRLRDSDREQDVIYKYIDVRKPGVYNLGKSTEYDFKDSWKFEVAAYELDKLLNLNMVPVTVERAYQGRTGSFQFWVYDCISEEERRIEKREPPSVVLWNWQLYKVWIFDKLIYNIDRNLGNLLVTPEWRCIMIDHSRSFKSSGKVEAIEKVYYFSKSMMEAIANLEEAQVRERCGRWLTDSEITTMMERRHELIEYYHEELSENGRSIQYP
jgi:hypothetical protein